MKYESVIALLKKEIDDKVRELSNVQNQIGILVAEAEDIKMRLNELEAAIRKLGE